jgi:hypothetical protein
MADGMPQLQCGVVESTLVLKVVSLKGHARRLGRSIPAPRVPGMGHASSIEDRELMYLLVAATESLRAGIRIGATESTNRTSL